MPSKLFSLLVSLFSFFLTIFLLLHLANPSPPQTIRRARPVMGTISEVMVYERNQEKAKQAIESAFQELTRIDRILSDYRKESEVSQLNRSASKRPFSASPELFQILSRALFFSKISKGAFDISVRPLMVLWGFRGNETVTAPTEAALKRTLTQVGYKNIQLNVTTGQVRFLKPGMAIDLGAIGKGYAVDRVVQVLQKKEIQAGMVNLGGNLFCWGKPCSIGIQNPLQESVLAPLTLANQGIATSGNYERFVEIKGKRYGHLLDPRTGWPVSGPLSVTVVAKSAELADILSTAVFVLGKTQGRKLLARFNAKGFWIYKTPSSQIHCIAI